MCWPTLDYRLAVHGRLCGVAFLESCVGSDYLALFPRSGVEIAQIEVEELTGDEATKIQKRPLNKSVHVTFFRCAS